MKEKRSLKESFIHFIKVITWQEYRDLKAEWVKQNKDLDKVHAERDKYKKERDWYIVLNETIERELNSMKNDYESRLLNKDNVYTEEIQKIETEKSEMFDDFRMKLAKKDREIVRLQDKVRDKETQRRKAEGKKLAASNKIKKLEHQVEFLKKHRRAPDLKEIKDWENGRKPKTVTEECEKK